MIGFLLALVLVVGGASWEGAAHAGPGAVAVAVERAAAARADRPSTAQVAGDVRVSCPIASARSLPRWRDLRCGGLPAPRAPDLAPARRR